VNAPKGFVGTLLLASSIHVAHAQRPSLDLDATVKRVMAEQHVVGASALVAQGGRILLHKGYGVADLGLDARKMKRSTTSSDRCCRSRASP
jgi:CubicO group peptidase (beta-lactamase class C family)